MLSIRLVTGIIEQQNNNPEQAKVRWKFHLYYHRSPPKIITSLGYRTFTAFMLLKIMINVHKIPV